MKYWCYIALIAFLFSFSAFPSKAERKLEAAPEISLDKPYRYANQKCEFSFQTPKSPQRRTLWGESRLPTRLVKNPGYGEVGEQLVYNIASLDKTAYFKVTAFCIYPPNPEIAEIEDKEIETELRRFQKLHDLKQDSVDVHKLPKRVAIGSLSGYKVFEESQDVTAYQLQIFKGRKSIFILSVEYSAEQLQYADIRKFIQDSIIFDP